MLAQNIFDIDYASSMHHTAELYAYVFRSAPKFRQNPSCTPKSRCPFGNLQNFLKNNQKIEYMFKNWQNFRSKLKKNEEIRENVSAMLLNEIPSTALFVFIFFLVHSFSQNAAQ